MKNFTFLFLVVILSLTMVNLVGAEKAPAEPPPVYSTQGVKEPFNKAEGFFFNELPPDTLGVVELVVATLCTILTSALRKEDPEGTGRWKEQRN
jgi:hypothetical protein